MAAIPGQVTEIRYRRTGSMAGPYYHTFRPGVRMHANRDGSVTLRGPRKIHATEDEPGFWEKYENPSRPRRSRLRRRRQARRGMGLSWSWLFAALTLLLWLGTSTNPMSGLLGLETL